MLTSSSMVKTFQLSAISMALVLAGCGGGGGGHNDTVLPPISSGSGSSTGASSSTGSTALAVNTSTISLYDTNNKVTQTISAAGVTAKVKVTDAAGKGISGALVTFTGTGVTFGTTNGAVLTNANGEASISVKPTSATDTGSYQMTAAAAYNGATATSAAYNYSLQAANTSISGMAAASTALASGGSTNITLSTIDASTNTAQPNVPVTFTATCGTFTNNSVNSTAQGTVLTTYKAVDTNGNLCSGTQTITATTANGTTQSMTVTVAAIQASSIVYTTTNPVQLGIKGSGSSTSGQIEFTVYANGVPATNQNVIVSKTLAPLDFSFVTLNNTTEQVIKSDSNGKVVVNIYPGALPGPVELKATLQSDSSVSALSKNVSVATGRASQNGFSIALSKNVLALNTDGDTATITARVVDRLGNAVPDGTVVSFLAEGGAISPTCATSGGVCTATFTTQNPRPADGRVTIIAYLEGDKSYLDTNGDNQYTAGVDTLTNNIGDFFRDDNEDGIFNTGEFIYKRGATGACGTSTFNQPNVPGTCDNNLSATLRYETVLGLASNTPTFDVLPNTLSSALTSYSFKMYGNNAKTIPMASGTTIAIAANDKTSYSPSASLVTTKTAQQVAVTGAPPNTLVTVNYGGIESRTGNTDSNGNVVVTGFAITTSGSISITPTITSYTPTGTASSYAIEKKIAVQTARPNSTQPVSLDGTIYNIITDNNGYGEQTGLAGTITASPTVIDTNATCKVDLVSGNLTVPAINNLNGGTVADDNVAYKFNMSGCQPTDEVKVTVTTPSPDAGTHTYTITLN